MNTDSNRSNSQDEDEDERPFDFSAIGINTDFIREIREQLSQDYRPSASVQRGIDDVMRLLQEQQEQREQREQQEQNDAEVCSLREGPVNPQTQIERDDGHHPHTVDVIYREAPQDNIGTVGVTEGGIGTRGITQSGVQQQPSNNTGAESDSGASAEISEAPVAVCFASAGQPSPPFI